MWEKGKLMVTWWPNHGNCVPWLKWWTQDPPLRAGIPDPRIQNLGSACCISVINVKKKKKNGARMCQYNPSVTAVKCLIWPLTKSLGICHVYKPAQQSPCNREGNHSHKSNAHTKPVCFRNLTSDGPYMPELVQVEVLEHNAFPDGMQSSTPLSLVWHIA